MRKRKGENKKKWENQRGKIKKKLENEKGKIKNGKIRGVK